MFFFRKINKFGNKLNGKFTYTVSRCFSEAETLEPVKLSYATYENTKNNVKDPQCPPPLVVMHGLFGSKSNWNSLCKVYEQKTQPQRKIIAIDARNHGDSPHTTNHTYAHLVADVRALLDYLKIDKAAFLGHSMGGRAVMLFALKYPEFVEKLIVADISPITTSPNLNTMPQLFAALESVEMPKNLPMSKARTFIDDQLVKFIGDKGLRAFLLTNLINDDDRYKWRINIPTLVNNFNNIAKFPTVSSDMIYSGPVLFAAGGNSDYVPIRKKINSNLKIPRWRHKKRTLTLILVGHGKFKSCSQNVTRMPKEALTLAYASYDPTDSPDVTNPNPLIISHGLLGSKTNWNTMCKHYVEKTVPKRKIYALDARNHGDSPHSPFHTYEHAVLDLRQFLTDMKMSKVCLLGHSMGGRTSMLFALKFPDLVEKLIVVDISPISGSAEFKKAAEILAVLKNVHFPKNVPITAARKTIIRQLLQYIPNRNVIVFLMSNMVAFGDGSFGWRVNVPSLIHNYKYISTFPEVYNVKFDGPVLFVGGKKSDGIQQTDFPKIKDLFPNAELKYIEGAGHWLHADKPKDFLDITLDFLNKTN